MSSTSGSSSCRALAPYAPPLASAALVLTTPTRRFTLTNGGEVNITQRWGDGGARTGSAVWDASFVLADYIDARCAQWPNVTSAVEVGSSRFS